MLQVKKAVCEVGQKRTPAKPAFTTASLLHRTPDNREVRLETCTTISRAGTPRRNTEQGYRKKCGCKAKACQTKGRPLITPRETQDQHPRTDQQDVAVAPKVSCLTVAMRGDTERVRCAAIAKNNLPPRLLPLCSPSSSTHTSSKLFRFKHHGRPNTPARPDPLHPPPPPDASLTSLGSPLPCCKSPPPTSPPPPRRFRTRPRSSC